MFVFIKALEGCIIHFIIGLFFTLIRIFNMRVIEIIDDSINRVRFFKELIRRVVRGGYTILIYLTLATVMIKFYFPYLRNRFMIPFEVENDIVFFTVLMLQAICFFLPFVLLKKKALRDMKVKKL